jgi:hypothetical protein
MYKLFTDKSEIFECSIQLEGASLRNSQARLVVETKDIIMMFKGEIDNSGNCRIPIKRLKGLLDESARGQIKLEVIADDTYFMPWDSEFEVETARKVTVEVKNSNTKPVIKESQAKVVVTQNTQPTSKTTSNSNKPQTKPKENLVESRKNHIFNILKLLRNENININNIATRRNQLNEILGGYVNMHQISDDDKSIIINSLLQGLLKLK